MPVPVPCVSKPPAHPVIKPRLYDNGKTNSFGNLTRTLPVSPTGPPPSFGTREEWINSLPSWRRSKPRRIWEEDFNSERISPQQGHGAQQGFYQGLAVSDNASAIKGSRAEACLPPLSSPPQLPSTIVREDVEMYPPHLTRNQGYCGETTCDALMHTVRNGAMEMEVDRLTSGVDADDMYGTDSFTPFYEDESPNGSAGHAGSSPIEPVTPFVDYVDRAVAVNHYATQEWCHESKPAPQFFSLPPVAELTQEPVPAATAVPDLVAPTATAGYRKLSEPLSEWIANFVWKACTTGSNLPSFIPRIPTTATKGYAASAPPYLATSVHSLLLSTLLQPSAIFLALWYIVKLPVSFGVTPLNADAKELHFRLALLGDRNDAMESTAPFRLIVLGCMLANKWLDDHTFSNKTWHTISNIPVQSLNKLESLSLDIFRYDLTISPKEWSQWLSHVMSYHLSLSSPSYPQPISRPSSNPSSIIRMAIDEIIQAPSVANFDPKNPQPVFLGLEERKKERMLKDQANSPIEFDFDGDGPLRREYVPKRRVSNARNSFHMDEKQPSWEMSQNGGKGLPPPARWSPAADEPILRESNRIYGRYVAVQPTPANNFTAYPPLPSYQHARDVYQSQWMFNAYSAAEVQPLIGYSYEMPLLQQAPPPPVYNHCAPLLVPPPYTMSHSRSQSLSHEQDTSQPRNHMRSFSQSRTDVRHADSHMTKRELPPVRHSGWGSTYAYHHTLFAPPANYPWL
ncbi:hypothetical protein V5O48_008232 [Marasmius crinis-equi]|uniref:Cyclin n=1 Tax=Marasmius crinis-equi TaxID=585013 RepID=A0ABR3FEL4_9AGAR